MRDRAGTSVPAWASGAGRVGTVRSPADLIAAKPGRATAAEAPGGVADRVMKDQRKFATLRSYRRVWAVAAVHGEAERLQRLHAALWRRLEPGDRIVLPRYTMRSPGR